MILYSSAQQVHVLKYQLTDEISFKNVFIKKEDFHYEIKKIGVLLKQGRMRRKAG